MTDRAATSLMHPQEAVLPQAHLASGATGLVSCCLWKRGSPVSRRCQIRSPHPRVAATFALIPLIVGLEILMAVLGDFLESHFNSVVAFLPAGLFPGLMLYLGCLLIWRPAVDWTPRRRLGLLGISLAFALLLLLAAGLPPFLRWGRGSSLIALLSTGLVGSGLALWAAAWICHDVPEPAKVACPSCGYDLRGQRECRCPECGQEYTLGELAGRSED